MSKLSKKFEKLIDFIEFTHQFEEIVRVARPPLRERFENDAEHSYQLAMIAWFLIDEEKLNLSKELCLMYALSHDLVEIYAGDTYFLDHKHTESKHQREMEALKKIKKRFPKFKSLISAIENFEKRADEESKFVYALDKLIPPIQIYLEGGKLWKEKEVFLDKLLENKKEKIAHSKLIQKYWNELVVILKKDRKKLFP